MAKAAKAFEAIFVRQLIGTMRSSSLGEGIDGSTSVDQFREMSDARTAEDLANKGGLGIAELILKQLDKALMASSDLFSIGASGVRAHQAAMGAVSENIANANTPGYSRRSLSRSSSRRFRLRQPSTIVQERHLAASPLTASFALTIPIWIRPRAIAQPCSAAPINVRGGWETFRRRSTTPR